jgi:cobalt/nickel transport system permease protein
MLTGDEFIPAAKLVFFAHIPIMVIEALLTGAAVYLVRKVRPDLFTAVKEPAE